MAFREVTWEEAQADLTDPDFREAVRIRLENVEEFPDVEGVLFFRNPDMWSSSLGASSILPYGPKNTFKGADVAAMKINAMKYWLNNLPSQRQYPEWYISRKTHLEASGEK